MHGTGRMLTLLVFGSGLMVGVIMMSLITNYKSLSHHVTYKSTGRLSVYEELAALVEQHNKTLAPREQEPVYFRDGHLHNDEGIEAKRLQDKVRILCWVLTIGRNHQHKAIHVKATWGKRCTKFMFISDTDDPSLPAININIPAGREHLTAKTMKAFDIFYKEVENFDWFMKADDDSFVILENLRYFLSSQNPDSPIYFGHHFRTALAQGYFSGGGGYVISREALRRFGKRKPNTCSKDDGAEDVEFGRCMEKLGVHTGDSRDIMGRNRFHALSPSLVVSGDFPDWYFEFDKYGGKKGIGNISDYAISFHYVGHKDMYNMELFIYHIRPYGIHNRNQDLNAAAQVEDTASQNTSKSTS